MQAERNGEPSWLSTRRARASERSTSLELPTRKSTGWEFTDLDGLKINSYPAAIEGNADAVSQVQPLFAPIDGACKLAQVDGLTLDPECEIPDSPSGPLVTSLSDAVSRFPSLVERHFGKTVCSEDVFVARNEAAWRGGAFIYVPAGTRLDLPVQLTTIQDQSGVSLNWRTLIVLDQGAQAEVWEQYLSSSDDVDGIFNAVTELSIGEGASLRYLCGQGLSTSTWIFGSQRAEVSRDGSLEWVTLGFGSSNGKVRMETKLSGPGAEARVTGAYVGKGKQHHDFDTTQEHAAPHTTSDLAFRGILQDRSTAVWRGMIQVDPGAQRTDAFQENRNLLLSKKAHADAIPGLEIEADDVRCTHAAAVAQIDRDQLFYLRSRGLSEESAKRLIVEGFLQALVERFEGSQDHNWASLALERELETVLR